MNDETSREEREKDATLRRAFQGLRDEEHRLGPGYAALRNRRDAPAPARPFDAWRRAWPAVALVAAGVLAWLVLAPPTSETPEPLEPGFQIGAWSMPTDVLLDLSALPGSKVMGDFDNGDPIESLRRDDARRSETQEETRWG